MIYRTILWATVAAIGLIGSGIAFGGSAVAATAAEKLYAGLAKLPQSERMKRLAEGAAKEGKLVFIQTITSKIGLNHGRLFNKRYPSVKLEMTQINTQEGAERLYVEESAGRHLTDLITLAVPDMVKVMDNKLSARYETPATDAILPQYKSMLDPEHRWTPWYWSEHGIIYNTDLLKGDKTPKSYFDLCKPHLKGQVSFDPAETRFLIGMHTMLGEEKLKEWLQCIGKNKPIIQQGHTTRLQLMIAGDHAASGDNYLYRGTMMQKKNPKKVPFKVAYEAPVLAYAAGFVINKNTSRPYAAALYTDWSLTVESQELMKKEFRGPVTLSHPYMPDSANLVSFRYMPLEMVDKLHGYWNQYVGKAR